MDPSTAPELPHDLEKELAKHTKANTEQAKAVSERLGATADSPVLMPIKAPAEKPQATDEDPLADDKTDAAVDDILQNESDEVLAAEDAARQPELQQTPRRRGFWDSIGHFFAAWWHNKWARGITLFIIFGAVAAAAAIPSARYYILNSAGVRSSMSLSVIDNGTRLPLKNVTVSLDGQTAKTNSQGVARLTNATLGKHHITISRVAFASITQTVVLGWGSNPLGSYALNPTGVRYEIKVTDYISGKPIAGAEAATDGDIAAQADKNGIITLTFDTSDPPTAMLAMTAKNYRDASLPINWQMADRASISLVPAQKEVFVSKQSGTYDLVSMYADGKDRKIILTGTGNESANIGLAVSPSGHAAALVSTRDALRDSDGFALSTLMVVDVDQSMPVTVTHAEQIQLVTWSGNELVFIETSAGASAANPNRFRLIGYDYATNKRTILATANEFNGMSVLDGMVYYAVSGTDPSTQPKMYRVRLDGTGRQTVLDKEVWTVVRTAYNTLAFQTPTGWYSYKTDGTLQQTSQPGVLSSRLYVDGPNNLSAWVDVRDGQGALLEYDEKANKDTTVKSQIDLTYPVRWLNDTTLIYRIASTDEIADYAVSITGGQAKKLTDVTNTFGFAY